MVCFNEQMLSLKAHEAGHAIVISNQLTWWTCVWALTVLRERASRQQHAHKIKVGAQGHLRGARQLQGAAWPEGVHQAARAHGPITVSPHLSYILQYARIACWESCDVKFNIACVRDGTSPKMTLCSLGVGHVKEPMTWWCAWRRLHWDPWPTIPEGTCPSPHAVLLTYCKTERSGLPPHTNPKLNPKCTPVAQAGDGLPDHAAVGIQLQAAPRGGPGLQACHRVDSALPQRARILPRVPQAHKRGRVAGALLVLSRALPRSARGQVSGILIEGFRV